MTSTMAHMSPSHLLFLRPKPFMKMSFHIPNSYSWKNTLHTCCLTLRLQSSTNVIRSNPSPSDLTADHGCQVSTISNHSKLSLHFLSLTATHLPSPTYAPTTKLPLTNWAYIFLNFEAQLLTTTQFRSTFNYGERLRERKSINALRPSPWFWALSV